MSAAAVLLVALLSQAPVAPAELALPGYRLHLVVDEDLDADALRSLAGSGTVLWLRTRSNMLRESTVEALARFPEVYVQLRAPLLEAHVRQFRRVPQAGAWLDAGALEAGGWHRLGPRRVAVEVRGPLDASLARRVARMKPSRVSWVPGEREATLEAWGHFAQLPGAKLLALGEGPGAVCPAAPARGVLGTVSLRANARTMSGPCELTRRVVWEGGPDDAALVALFSRAPSSELEVVVGAGEGELARARAWVRRLEAAVPRGVGAGKR
ncbi:hypothetical protein P2318_16040 [Myxococcaceae bacterium GXIMD 01537]